VSGTDGSSRKISGRVIAVTNNGIKPRPGRTLPYSSGAFKNIAAQMMGKGDGSTGELALYAFRGGLFRIAGILPHIVLGKWDRHKSVETIKAQHFVIDTENSSGAEQPFILDGEIKKTRYPLDVSIISKGVRIFKPQ